MATDLASLMKISPGVGGYFAGQDQANQLLESQNRQADLAQLMQIRMAQEQRAAEMHPLDMESKRFNAERAQAQAREYDAQAAERTYNTQRKRDDDDYTRKRKMFTDAMVNVGALAGDIENEPEVTRFQRLRDGFERMGITGQNADLMMGHFGKYSPKDLPAEIKRISEAVLTSSPDYRKKIDEADIKGQYGVDRAKISANARIQTADKKAAGGKGGKGSTNYSSEDETEVFNFIMAELKGRSPQTQLATLNRHAAAAADRGLTGLANKLRLQAAEVASTISTLPNAQPRAGDIDRSQLGVPTNPVARPHVQGGPQPGQGQTKSGVKFKIIPPQ